jgi:hypothetical protein
MGNIAKNPYAIGIGGFPRRWETLGNYRTPTGTTLIELRGLPSKMRSV